MYATPEELRAFLALCLDPGPGRTTRTPEELTRILPEPILDQLARFSPDLGALRSYADRRQRQADTARLVWAAALAEWIADEDPEDDQPTGCNGAALTHDETGICNHPAPAETAERLGHSTILETAAAYLGDDNRPTLPSALPWTELLRGAEFGNLLGEIALAVRHGNSPRKDESTEERHRRTVGLIDYVLAHWADAMEHRRPTTYLTPDGRVWTYRGEHQADEGGALYESASSPKTYTVPQLRDMYGWVATVDANPGHAPAEGEGVPKTFEDYARTCQAGRLLPYTTAIVHSGTHEDVVHAAVHVSVDPRLELSTQAVDAVRTAISDGLAYRDE